MIRGLTDEVSRSAVVVAVAAAPGYLAIVFGVEVLDFDGAAAVELDDLVIGVEGATAVDVRGTALLQKRDGVLTDVGPPDIVDRAGAVSLAPCCYCFGHIS